MSDHGTDNEKGTDHGSGPDRSTRGTRMHTPPAGRRTSSGPLKALGAVALSLCLGACSAQGDADGGGIGGPAELSAEYCASLASTAGSAGTVVSWLPDITKDAYRSAPPAVLLEAIDAARSQGGTPTLEVWLIGSDAVGADLTMPLDFPGDGQALRLRKRQNAVACAGAFVTRAEAAVTHSPILARIHAAVSNRPAFLVVDTNGLSNTAPLPLQELGPSSNWSSVLDQLPPTDLTGTRTAFVNLGATRSALLPAGSRASLGLFWFEWCRRARAAACQVDTRIATLPEGSEPVVSGKADPRVAGDWFDHGLIPACSAQRDIAGRVLFDGDSAVLRPQSSATVTELADLLLANPVLHLELIGHTATAGALAHRQSLSQARAAALRTAIVARGVPGARVSARGVGSTQPILDDRDAAGELIEAKAQANRRVTAHLSCGG